MSQAKSPNSTAQNRPAPSSWYNVGITAHYFTQHSSDEISLINIAAPVGGVERRLVSAEGVFSAARVDKGTAGFLKFLKSSRSPLQEAPAPETVLDLGCGWGILALEMAQMYPAANVLAVDVNRHAIQAAQMNFKALGFDQRAQAFAPEDLPADARFDLIVSNPPIRIGKTAAFELLDSYLQRLTPGGAAFFVIQKNLGADSLTKLLREKGWRAEKLAVSQGFQMIQAGALC